MYPVFKFNKSTWRQMTQWISVLEKDRQDGKRGRGCLKVRRNLRPRRFTFCSLGVCAIQHSHRGNFPLATGGWSVKHPEVAFPSLSYSRYEIANFVKIPKLPQEFQARGSPPDIPKRTNRLPNSTLLHGEDQHLQGEMAEKQPPHSYLMFHANGPQLTTWVQNRRGTNTTGTGSWPYPRGSWRASRSMPGLPAPPLCPRSRA